MSRRIASCRPARLRRSLATSAAAGLLAAFALAWPAAAQTPAPEAAAPAAVAPVEPDLIEPAAREAVKRMVETLTGAERMSYEYESDYDALQEDGEMLEFGSRGETTIRRPDRVRAEVWSREGRHVKLAWDGATISLYDEKRNIFASTPRTGDIDSFVDFMRDDVGFRLPVADLFSKDLRQMLIDNVVAARHVGKEDLRGVETDHVALRLRSGTDVQLWIRSGEEAVPERIALNFSTADGRPQFRSDFHDWDLDPRARDSLFELDPPKGAKKVPFALPPKREAEAPPQEDAQ
jgi:hypothetical protein